MINFRIIARIFSLLLIAEGFFMLIAAAISFIYDEEVTRAFLNSALITLLSGLIVFTPAKNVEKITGKKEGYIIITGAWLIFSLFGTLPYLFSHTVRSFTDAFFESISGFTTTGATIFNDVEMLPHGILFWRSITQWIGAMGIIFISLYILPVFKSINIQLPAADFSGHQTGKIHPRIKDAAKRLIVIFALLTLTEAIMLSLSGVPLFDSVCLSFSTMSTSSFSTVNEGITAFAEPFSVLILTFFMFLAGTSMSYIYFGLKGDYSKVYKNNEFMFFTIICFVFSAFISFIFMKQGVTPGKSIVEGSFHAVSVITTTGLYINDGKIWSDLLLIIFFVLMLTGGTSGSPSGGLKMIRLLIVTKNSKQELSRLLHPYAYMPVKIDNKTISQTIVFNILVIISLYFLVICISALIISLMGSDLLTSFSTSLSMIANIGPSLGETGISTNFGGMPVPGKWFMSALMLLGRLELLTVMIFFTGSFYRK
ncbi:MAG TPA: potassium transporter TrkG [Bacteroidales bacterium]|nr:potassium transporter TrkG [Bacteroidales bacterium]